MPHSNKRMLSFFLTTKCNLSCRYCYNAKERNSVKEQTIPMEIAEAAIEWYFQNNESRHIRFYGPGEPTQEFEKMKLITSFARDHNSSNTPVTVEIQTNGVFTSDVREWMLNNVNIAWMSFDGMKEIQNYNRPLNPKYSPLFSGKTSAEVLEENVKWLISNTDHNNLMVGARVTITDVNISLQKKMVDYFSSLGIKYIWTDPLFLSVGKVPACDDVKKRNAYSFDLTSYIDKYLEAHSYANRQGVFWGSFLAVNFDGESEYHCRSCHPLTAPHITPDGYISACDMVVLGSDAHHMGVFIVGNWNDETKKFDIDFQKVRALEDRASTNLEHCKTCPAKIHCGGYCPGETVNEFGRLDGQNPIKCNAVRKLYKALGPCEAYDYLHP